MRQKLKLTALVLSMLMLFTACGAEPIETIVIVEETTATTTTETTPPPPTETTVRVTAAGDNLIHSSIYNQAAKRSQDGTYDFDFAYENIEDIIVGDLNILNQETPVNDEFEPATYPCFCSPSQLGDKMTDLGFNAFNHANNHILDKGTRGVIATLDYWDTKENIAVCGAYRDTADMESISTLTINDITFSFLGFTEHTNGLRIPEDSEIRVIYTSETDVIEQQIKAAREISDVVVVSVHWGVENSQTVIDAQRNLGQNMADWGADIIIGTHPHVIQSMEEITAADGRNVLVAYSLGNFISAQSVNDRMIGGVLDFEVTKQYSDNSISIDNIKFIPVVTHYDYNYSNVRVYSLDKYTPELAASHGINVNSPFSYDFIIETLQKNIDEEYLVLPEE